MPDSHDLGVLISGANPLIALETRDENGALEFLRRLARDRDCDLYRWSVTDGLQSFRFALQLESSAEYDEPESVLDYIK
ncbi:MAG: AAA family ATPase, partial [bacterium]